MIIVKISDKNFKPIRIDRFLQEKYQISFSLAQKIIRENKLKINHQKAKAGDKISFNDEIKIFANLTEKKFQEKKSPSIGAEKLKKFDQLIIYQDENIAIINKPSGISTQGGSKIDISVDDFVKIKKWQLVHRLDKDTSGLLMIAKNYQIADYLTTKFRNKQVKKTYLALVVGDVKKNNGEINIPLLKKNLGKNDRVLPDFEFGKEAITKFKVLKKYSDYTLLELSPITGRTHQIRVHCKEIGHPIINDFKYGREFSLRKEFQKRLCLHAYKIEIADYFEKKLMLTSQLPDFLNFHNELK